MYPRLWYMYRERILYGSVANGAVPGSGSLVFLAASPAVLALAPSPLGGDLLVLQQQIIHSRFFFSRAKNRRKENAECQHNFYFILFYFCVPRSENERANEARVAERRSLG